MASSLRKSSPARRAQDEDRLDAIFGALSDRTRRAMLARLAQGAARVTELAEPHTMSLPAVSRHLKVLERAGLVRREVTGREHRCELEAAGLHAVEAWLDHHRAFWEGQLDALAAFAQGAAPPPGGKAR